MEVRFFKDVKGKKPVLKKDHIDFILFTTSQNLEFHQNDFNNGCIIEEPCADLQDKSKSIQT